MEGLEMLTVEKSGSGDNNLKGVAHCHLKQPTKMGLAYVQGQLIYSSFE